MNDHILWGLVVLEEKPLLDDSFRGERILRSHLV